MTKKLLSILLAALIVCSVITVSTASLSVSAATDEGDEVGISSDTLYVGGSAQYRLTPYYIYIRSTSATSSNTSVATVVNNGNGYATVYAKKAGVAVITIRVVSYNRYNYVRTQTASITITVKGYAAAPTGLSLQNKGTGFYINWKKASGAAKYRVFYKSQYDDSWSWDTTSNNYMYLTYLAPGVLYYVQVRSIDSSGNFGGITKASSLTHVRGTTLYSTAYNSNGTTTVKWNYASGANGYAVAKKKSTDKNFTYYYTSSTSFTDKNVTAGAQYYYQIRPYYSNGKSAAYAEWSNSKSITTLFKPTLTSVTINASRANANWNAIKGATGYKVAFKRTTDSAWNYRTTTSRYYNVTNPTAGATYVFQVCALNGSLAGPWSASKSVSYQTLSTPTLSGNTNGTRNYLSWNSVSGATGYQIAKKTTQQSSYTYYTTTSTAYYDYNFTDGKTYTYQVRAYNGSTYGPWSNVLTLKPPVDVPSVYLFEKYSNRLQAEWSAVQGAAYYRIAYMKAGGSWQYETVYDTEWDLFYPESNTYYYFSVYAVGENGTTSDWSDDKVVYT